MSTISGALGAVNGVHTVQNWSIDSEADLQAYVASNTKGGTGRMNGNKKWKGTYKALGHTPVQMPGSSITFTGTIDNVKGASGAAIVEQCEIVINIESGEIINYTTTFGSDGALSLGANAATDVVVPNPPTSIGCKVEIGTVAASPEYTELADVRTVTITLTSAPNTYVSSGTAGIERRYKGPYDVQLAISVYCADFASLPAENAIGQVRCYVDATTYWDFKWVRWGGISGMLVDPSTQAVVGATINGGMHGYTNVSATPTAGYVKNPATTAWWTG